MYTFGAAVPVETALVFRVPVLSVRPLVDGGGRDVPGQNRSPLVGVSVVPCPFGVSLPPWSLPSCVLGPLVVGWCACVVLLNLCLLGCSIVGSLVAPVLSLCCFGRSLFSCWLPLFASVPKII